MVAINGHKALSVRAYTWGIRECVPVRRVASAEPKVSVKRPDQGHAPKTNKLYISHSNLFKTQ